MVADPARRDSLNRHYRAACKVRAVAHLRNRESDCHAVQGALEGVQIGTGTTTGKEGEKEEPKVKETSALADQGYYVVQKVDSLLGISQKIYGKDYTKQLCELNALEDENKIYAGQKLLLLDK